MGHFTLAPVGTPTEQLTRRNKAGGDTLIAFAVLHVFSFAVFWGPTPWVYLGMSLVSSFVLSFFRFFPLNLHFTWYFQVNLSHSGFDRKVSRLGVQLIGESLFFTVNVLRDVD